MEEVGAKPFEIKEDVFYVNDYGAIDNGLVLITEAIQKAIDACAENGGSTVTFRQGIYLTGSVFIKGGIALSYS